MKKKPFEEEAFDFDATIFEANQNLFDSTIQYECEL